MGLPQFIPSSHEERSEGLSPLLGPRDQTPPAVLLPNADAVGGRYPQLVAFLHAEGVVELGQVAEDAVAAKLRWRVGSVARRRLRAASRILERQTWAQPMNSRCGPVNPSIRGGSLPFSEIRYAMAVVRSSAYAAVTRPMSERRRKDPFAKIIGMLTQGPYTLASGREAGKTRAIRLFLWESLPVSREPEDPFWWRGKKNTHNPLVVVGKVCLPPAKKWQKTGRQDKEPEDARGVGPTRPHSHNVASNSLSRYVCVPQFPWIQGSLDSVGPVFNPQSRHFLKVFPIARYKRRFVRQGDAGNEQVAPTDFL